MGRPPHLIMRVMDCVLILFRRKLIKIESDPTVPSPLPSWQESLKIMSGTSFLSELLNYPKDTINDEMVELLEPYFTMEDYNTATANRVCRCELILTRPGILGFVFLTPKSKCCQNVFRMPLCFKDRAFEPKR